MKERAIDGQETIFLHQICGPASQNHQKVARHNYIHLPMQFQWLTITNNNRVVPQKGLC